MENSNGPGPASQRGVGVDEAMESRPGVPMEAAPLPVGPGAESIPRQGPDPTRPRRRGIDQLTPVYGTAQPVRGVSGMMRRVAYAVPEHSAMHWAMLLSADRVDVIEDRLTHGIGPDTLSAMGRRVRTNPLPALALAVVAGFAARRALR